MKTKILEVLYQQQNSFVSGEKMSLLFNVSRVTISKYIKQLKLDGFDIESLTNKGYCLRNCDDYLSSNLIKEKLSSFYRNVEVIESCPSTNDLIRTKNNLKEGDILIADHQTAGKGRNGRSFYSPAKSGIYLSLYLEPKLSLNDSLKITACAGVSIQQAIMKLYGLPIKIKWVNDLYITDKKIAGILCEASYEMNTATIDHMVVGMGINVHETIMPDDLINIASSIDTLSLIRKDRNTLIIEILNQFEYYYKTINKNTFLPIYIEYSNIINQAITIYQNGISYDAKAIGFNESAHLIIEKENKEIIALTSGEVTVRIKKETT